MKKRVSHRVLAVLLAALMAFTFTPLPASAKKSVPAAEGAYAAHYPDRGAVKVEIKNFGAEPTYTYGKSTAQALLGKRALSIASQTGVIPSKAYDTLTGREKQLYDNLKAEVFKVAGGEVTNTIFDVPAPGYDLNDETDIGDSWRVVLYALSTDFPYELCWHERGKGVSMSYWSDSDLVTFSFYVSRDYSVGGEPETFETDPEKIAAAKASIENANRLVEANASKSDIEKLRAYKDYICTQVSYDKEAAANSTSEWLGPWQLINVFDNDENTNVVCEGYSKAFQYLCNKSNFQKKTPCYHVAGLMDGGLHAWNVVRIDDAGYLTDITNCDAGTVGCFDVNPDGSIKMKEDFGSGLFLLNCGGMYGAENLPPERLSVQKKGEGEYEVIRGKVTESVPNGSRTWPEVHIGYGYDDWSKLLYTDEALSLDAPVPPAKPLVLTYSKGFEGKFLEIGKEITPVEAAVEGGSGEGHTFGIKNGQLPQGLTLDQTTGTISGTPAVPSEGMENIRITVEVKDSKGNTAECEVVIPPVKRRPIYNPPTGLTAFLGQKLKDIELKNPAGNTEGTWKWENPDADVGGKGEHSAPSWFSPSSDEFWKPDTSQQLKYTVESLGDLDDDGKVDVRDAQLLLKLSCENGTLTEGQAAVADVNHDGKCNVIDARWLLQVSSGNRTLK